MFLSEALAGMASRNADGVGTELSLRAKEGDKLGSLALTHLFEARRG